MKSRIPPPEKAQEHCCAVVGLVATAGGPTPARAPHLHTTHSRPLLEHAGFFWNMLHGPGSRQCLWPQARPAGPGRQVHRPVFVCLKTSLP